jgi:cytochrome c
MIGLLLSSMNTAPAQDIAAGEQSFKRCAVCHAVGEDAKNRIGPALNGLQGRKSGAVEDYSYTEANRNGGLTWDEVTFMDYIKAPKAKIPGTKMVFSGIKDEKEIKDLWAYLAQFAQDSKTK